MIPDVSIIDAWAEQSREEPIFLHLSSIQCHFRAHQMPTKVNLERALANLIEQHIRPSFKSLQLQLKSYDDVFSLADASYWQNVLHRVGNVSLNLEHLILGDSEIARGADLHAIGRLERLRAFIYAATLPNSALFHLATLPCLEELEFKSSETDLPQLPPLAFLRLRWLNLSSARTLEWIAGFLRMLSTARLTRFDCWCPYQAAPEREDPAPLIQSLSNHPSRNSLRVIYINISKSQGEGHAAITPEPLDLTTTLGTLTDLPDLRFFSLWHRSRFVAADDNECLRLIQSWRRLENLYIEGFPSLAVSAFSSLHARLKRPVYAGISLRPDQTIFAFNGVVRYRYSYLTIADVSEELFPPESDATAAADAICKAIRKCFRYLRTVQHQRNAHADRATTRRGMLIEEAFIRAIEKAG
jgi:hypothetical protein